MDLPGRSNGSDTSNASDFMSSNGGRRTNHQQPTRFHPTAKSSFLQESQSASDQRALYQVKMQEMPLRNIRQSDFDHRMQHQMSPSSSQQQQMPQPGREQQRRSSSFSPNALLRSPSSLISPNYGRPLWGSPSSHSFAGTGSISSIKSVFAHLQQPSQSSQSVQFPPAPPLGVSGLACSASAVMDSASTTSSHKNEKHSSETTYGTHAQTNTVNTLNKEHLSSSIPKLGPDETEDLVNKCDWIDKTLWVARQVFGGSSVNSFLRSTAAVQRIKKQRIKQNNRGSLALGNVLQIGNSQRLDKKRGAESVDPEAAHSIKKEVMNVRTAKRMKIELEMGIKFCRVLHSTIRSILLDMDPSLPELDQLHYAQSTFESQDNSRTSTRIVESPVNLENSATVTVSSRLDSSTHFAMSNSTINPTLPGQESSCASPGNPSGSTLRKNRKKKIPPNPEPPIDLPEFDSSGKRLCTKKEHFHRLFECIRYRALTQGDVVAARVSSRNLWILARVLHNYPASNLPLLDFVRLPDLKREQLFKDKVLIKDVEDKVNDTESAIKVSRSLILPLPRSVSEAADWGQRYKKGSRVYALYPNTTALYTATILDATTYARDDDDIIVVRFDGDEPDASGTIPSCHIPARFVTLIPRGFPGELSPLDETNMGAGLLATVKKKKGFGPDAPIDLHLAGNLDDLKFDDHLTGIDDFDDLDFDLLGDS